MFLSEPATGTRGKVGGGMEKGGWIQCWTTEKHVRVHTPQRRHAERSQSGRRRRRAKPPPKKKGKRKRLENKKNGPGSKVANVKTTRDNIVRRVPCKISPFPKTWCEYCRGRGGIQRDEKGQEGYGMSEQLAVFANKWDSDIKPKHSCSLICDYPGLG